MPDDKADATYATIAVPDVATTDVTTAQGTSYVIYVTGFVKTCIVHTSNF